MAGRVRGRARVWQERRPLQRTVRILLECFLVREQFASCEVDFNNMEIVYNDNSQILLVCAISVKHVIKFPWCIQLLLFIYFKSDQV